MALFGNIGDNVGGKASEMMDKLGMPSQININDLGLNNSNDVFKSLMKTFNEGIKSNDLPDLFIDDKDAASKAMKGASNITESVDQLFKSVNEDQLKAIQNIKL